MRELYRPSRGFTRGAAILKRIDEKRRIPSRPMSASSMLLQPTVRSAQETQRSPALPTWWPGRERLTPDFRLDRRRAPRWRIHGTTTLLGLGVDLGKLLELSNLDCSPWWLAGDSSARTEVGMRVSVGFSNPMCRPNAGTIMRCERTHAGLYRIALRFDGAFLC
jgi:hypothetical protein